MRSLLVAVLALTAISTSVLAQAPDSLSFQGFLTDSLGNPIDSTGVGVTFKLYKGGVAVWTEPQTVDVNNGVFNVLLGTVTDLSMLAFDQPMDLGVKLDNEASEMSPRTPLVAGAFALGMRGMYAVWASDGFSEGYNVIGGGNSVSGGVVGATIGGGGGSELDFGPNNSVASKRFAPPGLSLPNIVTGDFGTVAGGQNNSAGRMGFVGGGNNHVADGGNATVGGGHVNYATGPTSTIGGGLQNRASANNATVSGGANGKATGQFSTVPGGWKNQARGTNSFAAGYNARAKHSGTFVWNDRSITSANDSLLSTADNQFLARASGGVTFLTAAGPDLTTGAVLAAGSGTWADLSSEAAKNNFSTVEGRSYLERVADLELKEWSYKTEQGVTHVGPMAEEFHAAFGLGPNDHSITTVDGNGVALAAIQGLYELVKELQAEVEALRAERR